MDTNLIKLAAKFSLNSASVESLPNFIKSPPAKTSDKNSLDAPPGKVGFLNFLRKYIFEMAIFVKSFKNTIYPYD